MRLAGARGYAVCVNYRRDRAAAEHVVRDVEAAGSTAIAVRADVAIEAEVVRLFEESHTQLGALSALVNNTEILETQARLDAMTVDRLQRIFTTNVIGAVHRRDRRPIGVDSCDLSFQFAVISARIDGRFTRMRPKETPC